MKKILLKIKFKFSLKKKIYKNIKKRNFKKKLFNNKNLTFDSNGKIIPLKKFNINNINNNNIIIKTTVKSKEIIKDKNNFYIENYDEIKIENNSNNNLNKFFDFHNNKFNKIKIISGSSFNLIKPEFGVIITENNKIKNGTNDYLKKNKFLTEIKNENNNNNNINNNNNNIFKNVKKINFQKKKLNIQNYNKIIVKSKSFQNIIKNNINEEKILKINNKNINNNKNIINNKNKKNSEKFKLIDDFNKAIIEKNLIKLEKIPFLPNLNLKHSNNENKKLILKNNSFKNLRERKKNFNNNNENSYKNLLKLIQKRNKSEKNIKKQ